MKTIDINVDVGEAYAEEAEKNDAALMPFVTSVNIACGFHAGDYKTMAKTIELAIKNNNHIGAHPSYPDREGFGRRPLEFSIQDIKLQLLYQIGALDRIAKYHNGRLHHVKPHGALYNEAAKNYEVAYGIAEVIASFGKDLIFVGLCNSQMEKAAKALSIPFWGEAFADRRYDTNGFLVARTADNAIIDSVEEMINQVKTLLESDCVRTICIHGDTDNALTLSKALNKVLEIDKRKGEGNESV